MALQCGLPNVAVGKGPALNAFTAGGMDFGWLHRHGRLHATLSAPTDGWFAVGFNDHPRLEGTRFVIATVSREPIRAQEHIALVPAHQDVASLGLEETLGTLEGNYDGERSYLSFSLPEVFPDANNPTLSAGQKTHLMLAWSTSPDFGHHSRWRRHFDVVL